MRRTALLIVLFIPGLGGSGSLADEYFVARRGSDTASGDSVSTAFLTVGKGLSVLKPGDTVDIVGLKPEIKTTVCTSMEMFRKVLDEVRAGDNAGLLLRGVSRTDVERGMVIAKPKSITPHTKFEGQVYVLTKEEGGRHTQFFSGYRPQFYFRTTDVTGTLTLPEGVDMVMPGDNVTIVGELIQPIAMEEGLRFAIREGGRTVASGVVSKILE